MKRQKIHVTEQDIKDGCRASASGCPVAKAVAKALVTNKHEWVTVTGRTIIRHQNTFLNGLIFRTPWRVRTFIRRFDNKRPVKPFKFWLVEKS